jgi:hypothetical protein
MKARYYGLVPKKISIFLKTKDFKYVTSSITLPVPSSSPEIINAFAHAEFEKIYKKGITYRTTGVVLVDLMSNFVFQKDLFGGTLKAEKFEEIHKQIDLLEEKFGRRIVHLGSTHNALEQKKLGTDSDDLERDLLFL